MNQPTTTFVAQRATSNSFGRKAVFVPSDTPGTGFYTTEAPQQPENAVTETTSEATPEKKENNKVRNGMIALAIMWGIVALIFYIDWFVFGIVCSTIFGLISLGVIGMMLPDKKKTNEQTDKQVEPVKHSDTTDYVALANEQMQYAGEEEQKILQNFILCYETNQEVTAEEIAIAQLENQNTEEAQNQIALHKANIDSAMAKLAENQIDIDKDLSESEKKNYFRLCEAFEKMTKAERKWVITEEIDAKQKDGIGSVSRYDAELSVGAFCFLKTSFDVPVFATTDCNYYIYPKYIIAATDSFHFNVFPHSGNTLELSTSSFHEDETPPSDAKLIRQAWLYTLPNGDPDKNRAGNRQRPVLRYHSLYFTLADKPAKFMLSSGTALNAFKESFDSLNLVFADKENAAPIFAPTTIDFNTISQAASNLAQHVCLLDNRTDALAAAQKSDFVAWADSEAFATNPRLAAIAIFDAVRCYEQMGYSLDLRDNEALGLAVFILALRGNECFALAQNEETLRTKGIAAACETIEMLKRQFGDKSHNGLSLLVDVLKYYKVDTAATDKYAVLLYRLASVLAKTDGVISQKEEAFLARLLSFAPTAQNAQEQDEIMTTDTSQPSEPQPTTPQKPTPEDVLKKLDELIGLDSVKTEMKRINNFVKVQQMRADKGLATSQLSYHCVFTGNPGTGKTTVARILAEIYKSYGVVTKGHLIETDRAGLVAEYVGQTAVKTNKIIDSALDGVLFIDEAYSLCQGGKNDYGIEAISTLLKRMEDNRDRLIVILAGYQKEMKDFIDTNPGLQSRFNRYIAFTDYDANDLLAILKQNVSKCDYVLTPDAESRIAALFDHAVANKDKNFGNGRYARNILEKILENQAMRLASVADITEEKLKTIEADDIPNT